MQSDPETELNKKGIGCKKNRPLDRDIGDFTIIFNDSAALTMIPVKASRVAESSNGLSNHRFLLRNRPTRAPAKCFFRRRFVSCSAWFADSKKLFDGLLRQGWVG